ncbi:MAG: hypothetical protein IIZ21_00190 [Firmicutes bacterium]|nr:hypothetical protein [Bacillota bacterium]
MKNVSHVWALALSLLVLSTAPVFADAAIGPAFAIVGAGFILAIAGLIICLVLLIKTIRRRKNGRTREEDKK